MTREIEASRGNESAPVGANVMEDEEVDALFAEFVRRDGLTS